MLSLPISLPDAALATVIVAVGAAIQGSVGMGLGMLAAPLLLLLDASFVPGPLLGAALLLTIFVTHRDREAIDLRGLKYALAGRVVGTVPAAALLSVLPLAFFDVVFGTLVIVAVAITAFAPGFAPTPARAVGAGVLAGFMATISSIGGPPMALLYQHQKTRRLRGTLAGFFLVGATLSIAALAIIGRFGRAELLLTALLAPGIVLGFLVSGPLARRLDARGVRPLVLAISAGSALLVLWRAFSP